jgi:hypothetical protein
MIEHFKFPINSVILMQLRIPVITPTHGRTKYARHTDACRSRTNFDAYCV